MGTKLNLRGSTANALASFKKRNDDARRRVQMLSEQPQTVDFAAYRSQLKNQDIVADVEKQFQGFAIKKVDVARQVKAIEAFEAQAVKSAEETKGKVDAELKDLEKTLKNIETARPFEDLTVVSRCCCGLTGMAFLALCLRHVMRVLANVEAIGRGCGGAPGHLRACLAARVQGTLAGAGLQGKFSQTAEPMSSYANTRYRRSSATSL